MEIRRLDKEIYAGGKFTARYTTGGYYDICASESGFQMRYTAFATPVEKSFEDVFLASGWRIPLRSARLREKN